MHLAVLGAGLGVHLEGHHTEARPAEDIHLAAEADIVVQLVPIREALISTMT